MIVVNYPVKIDSFRIVEVDSSTRYQLEPVL